MKSKFLFLALVLSGVLFSCSTATKSSDSTNLAGTDVDRSLTKQITDTLGACQKIKPGMTRAKLLKVFTTEGGVSTAKQQTFVYRGCPYIKVDVEFTLTEPGQNVLEERPTDAISKISRPYLDWSNID